MIKRSARITHRLSESLPLCAPAIGISVSIKAMVAATIFIMANLPSFHSPLFVDDCLRMCESGAALIASDGSASLPGIRRGHTRPTSSDESVRPRTLSGL